MPVRLKKYKIILILSCLFFICGCATVYNPATRRKEFIFIDTASEVSLGLDMDREIGKEFELLEDFKMLSRLNSIGSKVALSSDRQDVTYTFKIIKDDTLNAFAIPGGYVYVNSGLLKRSDDNELACVLGHEIGHIAARHSVKRLQANLGYQLLIAIAQGATKEAEVLRALNVTYNVVALGYSRQDEFLADKLAVKYSKASGFNPYGMVNFFRKLEAEKKPGVELVFLSSHPPVKDRITAVEKEILNDD